MAEGDEVEMQSRGRLLTVVIPIADDGRYVEQLLGYWQALFLGKNLSDDVEFVLVDQSPTNEPGIRLAEKLSTAGYSLELIRQEPATGPGAARQLGLGMATTDFVCFVDVDDRSELSVYIAAANLALQESLDVVAVGYQVSSSDLSIEFGRPPREGHFWEDLLIRRVGVWRFVFRRQMLDANLVSFPPWDYAEDLVFLVRCARVAPRVGFLSQVGYVYELHRTGLSGRRPTRLQQRRAVHWLRSQMGAPLDTSVRFIVALWLARISLLGGWRTCLFVVPTFTVLLRRPVNLARYLVEALAARKAERREVVLQ